MTEPWLGHENGCEIQWSSWCSCGPEPVDLSDTPSIEERPADDPWIPTCDGRDCGGQPHE